MTFSRDPGIMISAAVHFGLLAFMLVHFSTEQKFEDAQEAIPVDTISDAQFSQIMKGEKVKQIAAKPRADRVADKEDAKPTPPTPEAKHDVPTPPPPLKRLPDPPQPEEKPPTPTPPTPTPPPPTPPVRPAPTPPAKAQPPEKEDPEDKEAETVKPPPRPKPPEKKPEPPKPEPPKAEPPKPEPPKPPEKPKPTPPKLDQVADLLSKIPSKTPDKPASRPKSGAESDQRPSPNLADISKLLSHEAPKSTGSAGREVSHTPAAGSATGNAPKMSPSLSNALNGFFQERYKQCWLIPFSTASHYVPQIHVFYRPDGSLASNPIVVNAPPDASAHALADSAIRAVRSADCNPMKIPAQFQPYYEQWKDWVVRFDPDA